MGMGRRGGSLEGSNNGQQPRRCSHCLSQRTPQWRAGPKGPKTLCNACGVRYKSGRLLPEYRPAKSPTFVSYKHSNSHRKVLEMRNMSLLLSSNSQGCTSVFGEYVFRETVTPTWPRMSGAGNYIRLATSVSQFHKIIFPLSQFFLHRGETQRWKRNEAKFGNLRSVLYLDQMGQSRCRPSICCNWQFKFVQKL